MDGRGIRRKGQGGLLVGIIAAETTEILKTLFFWTGLRPSTCAHGLLIAKCTLEVEDGMI